MTKILGAWDRFWFEPVSPEPMAIFRIFFGLLLLVNGLLLAPDLFNYFGPDGFMSLETSRALADGLRINAFAWLPDSNISAVIVFSVYIPLSGEV